MHREFCALLLSPPTRRCGLKYITRDLLYAIITSPPTRRCGLKSAAVLHRSAPPSQSPPTRRCGLKSAFDGPAISILCHLLRGGVDWNTPHTHLISLRNGHLLRGGVDWNRIMSGLSDQAWRCHLLRGGVDWNQSASLSLSASVMSPPTRRCGLKF